MKKFSSYVLALSMAVSVASCKKDDAEPAGPQLTANETLLTAKSWRITAVVGATSFMGQTFTTDGYATMAACQRDNFGKYNADKTGLSDEGATKCSTSSPQTESFTWKFNAAETALTIAGLKNGTPVNIEAEVLQLSAATMILRTTTTQSQGGQTLISTATTTYASF